MARIAVKNHHTIAGDGALKFPSAAEPIRIKILISRYILERGWGGVQDQPKGQELLLSFHLCQCGAMTNASQG